MKNSICRFLGIIVLLFGLNTQSHASGGILFGCNWFEVNPKFLGLDSTRIFNAYHMTPHKSDDTLWLHGSSPDNKLIFSYDDGAIYGLSGAQRMMYQARDNAGNPTSYTDYYFLGRDTAGHNVPFSIYWKVASSPSDHTELRLLWQNEYSGSWATLQRFPLTQLKLAAKLKIDSLAPIDSPYRDSSVISIISKEHFDFAGHDSVVVIGRFDIKWDSITSLSDVVMFEPGYDSLYHDWVGTEASRDSGKGIEIEVWGRRYVNAYIKWVCAEDLHADSLLAGRDLDTGNTAKKNLAIACRSLIHDDSLAICTLLGPRFFKFYVADEPHKSQYAALGLLSSIMYLPNQTVTEYQGAGDELKRFLAQAKPNSLWRYTGGVGGNVCDYCDQGLDGGETSRVPFADTGVAVLDGYGIDTIKKYTNVDWGYLPHASGSYGAYDPKSVVALSDTYALAWYPRPGGGSALTDTSWDMFDYSREGTCNVLSVAINHCRDAASATFLDTTAGHPTEWWADNINESNLNNNGYYAGMPYIPSQYSAAFGVSLAYGSHGMLFYQGVTVVHGPGLNIGMVDSSGHYNSDSIVISGDTLLPSMFLRNGTWAKAHSRWLNSYAESLYTNAVWRGAFSRCGLYHYDSYIGTKGDTQSIGADTVVNVKRDHETRPIMTSWIDNATEDYIRSHSHEIDVDSSLAWLTYGFFDSKSDPDVKFLLCVNTWCDERRLNAEWGPQPDSNNVYSYAMRGRRTITTTLKRDSIKYYRVTLLDDHPWDTVITGNGAFVQTYERGQIKLFRISNGCDIHIVDAVDDNEISRNNGVHMIKRGDGVYRSVFVRHDSCFMRTVDECSLDSEVLICPAKVDSLFTFGPNHYVYRGMCHNPTIAQYRGSQDEALICWQRTDSMYTGVAQQQMLGAVVDGYGNIISPYDASLKGPYINLNGDLPAILFTYTKSSTTYRGTPVVVGCDSGYIVSWSDSTDHVNVAAIAGHGGSYRRSTNTLTLKATGGGTPAENPTIAWGTNAIRASGQFYPHVHESWQQMHNGITHIFHRSFEVHYQSGAALTLATITGDTTEQVSEKDGTGCGNEYPCITVNAAGHDTGASHNTVMITWRKQNGYVFLQSGHIMYRERFNPNSYGPFIIYASGFRSYTKPSVFVCPADSLNSSEQLVFYCDRDSMHLYLPGEFILHTYPLKGINPTLSFAKAMPDYMTWPGPQDVGAAAFYQTPSPTYKAVVARYGSVIGYQSVPCTYYDALRLC